MMLAALAKSAGVRYAVFTAKYHWCSGMYCTATTPFNMTSAPPPNSGESP
jgi:hypothetical protein